MSSTCSARPSPGRKTDGHDYFVKSAGAGWRSLICEWVAGRLAIEFGLPVPPVAQLVVEDALAATYRQRGDLDLAAGLAFGSKRVDRVRDFEPALLGRCDAQFRQDLVAFDWWVRNADRTLGELSGNPNLLWVTGESRPAVIDHNMAFEADFDVRLFCETHVFRDDFLAMRNDWVLQQQYQQRLVALLPLLDTVWPELPHDWLFDDDGRSRMTRDEVDQILEPVQHEGFWG